jgi:hypothetical protein
MSLLLQRLVPKARSSDEHVDRGAAELVQLSLSACCVEVAAAHRR